MTTYITGANGFLGSHLTRKLDNFVPVSHRDVTTADFSDATRVFFLSAYGNMATHTNTQAVVRANILDLAHVLASVDWKKIESFVFISTSSVKLKVQTTYSRTKKAAEELLLAYMEKYNAPITIIRPFSITGVGEQPQHLIPTLIRAVKGDTMINLAPEPRHDFIDVDDVVNGILNLSNNQARGIYELGTGNSYTNKEVLFMVEQQLNSTSRVTTVHGLRPYDSDNWVSTNFKARNWGWYPVKSLQQSIKEMIDAEQA